MIYYLILLEVLEVLEYGFTRTRDFGQYHMIQMIQNREYYFKGVDILKKSRKKSKRHKKGKTSQKKSQNRLHFNLSDLR